MVSAPAMQAAVRRLAGRGVGSLLLAAAAKPAGSWPGAAAAAPRPARGAAAAAATAAMPPSSATFLASSEAATSSLADLAGGYSSSSAATGVPPPSPGDVYALTGPVGAGKSAWARAFIRAAACDRDLAVPSPTYLLHNVYEEACGGGEGGGGDRPAIHHFDLYRLGGPGPDRPEGSDADGPASLAAFDVDRTGLGQALASGVSLIEWAERLGAGGAASAAAGAGVDAPPAVVLVHLAPLSPEGVAALLARATVTGCTQSGEFDADDDDPYTDARPRAVTLAAGPGSPARAAARVAAVAAAVRSGAGGPGLALVE